MPKELKEIKGFQSGIVLNSSEKDVPESAASFSLNINPNSEDGVLSGIETDLLRYLTSNTFSYAPEGFHFGQSKVNIDTADIKHNEGVLLNDISLFEDNNNLDIVFEGIKGSTEIIKATSIEPSWRRAWNGNDEIEFEPLATIQTSDESIAFTGSEFTIAFKNVSDDSSATITGCNITQSITGGVGILTVTGNTASDFDGKYFTLTSRFNKTVKYQFDNDASGPATGAASGGYTFIQLNGSNSSDNAAVATQIKTAIEHATYGHGYRFSCAITTSSSDKIVTITQTEMGLGNHVGKYFALATTTTTNFNGRISYEIIKIIDENNTSANIKRGCFGTSPRSYAAGTSFGLYGSIYKFQNETFLDTSGTIFTDNWSSKDGNTIGGNIASLFGRNPGATASYKRRSGIYDSVSFSSVTSMMTNHSISETDFLNANDTVTVYHSNSLNNGKEFKLLTLAGLLEGDNIKTETLTGSLYVEPFLIKNPTFFHNYNEPTNTDIGVNKTYKANKWQHRHLDFDGGDNAYFRNYLTDITTNTKVVRESSGGLYNDATSKYEMSSGAKVYPCEANDNYISIESQYADTYLNVLTTFDSDAEYFTTDSNSGGLTKLAVGAIIYIDNEYMEVTSMTSSRVYIKRGLYGTTADTHNANANIFRCVNHLISQDISKTKLYTGTRYCLKFFAKDLYTSSVNGYLRFALSINGGYFDKDGKWNAASKDINKGYGSTAADIKQEEKWLHMPQPSDTPYIDEDNKMDTTWRRYSYEFEIPKDFNINSDLTIEFSSMGKSGTKIGIDLPTLTENTPIFLSNNSDVINSVGKINNGDNLDLVLYNESKKSLSVLKNFKDSESSLHLNTATIDYSKSASKNLKSSESRATFIGNNRNLHIGFGSAIDDAEPQWLGYLNKNVFGTNYNDVLYQDSDKVDAYGGEGLYSLSKLCLAGEYENQSATWDGTYLTVTMNNSTLHNQSLGNNIIIREWGDTNNSWSGAGVWVITEITSTTVFKARRPSTEPAGSLPRNGKICFRPYYYYGFKKGESSIYRIWPDTRFKAGAGGDGTWGDLDSTYVRGTIERSLPFGFNIQSMCTFYNKSDDGEQGGKVYILSSDSVEGEISVIDLDLNFDFSNFKSSTITQIYNFTSELRALMWSNDHENGNIGGTTGVFNTNVLANEAAPVITKSGIFTDILETKGTSPTYNRKATSNTTNTPANFDTRLWLMSTPEPGTTFNQGSRFLFCTLSSITNLTNNIVKFADRSFPLSSCAMSAFTSYHDSQTIEFEDAPSTTSYYGQSVGEINRSGIDFEDSAMKVILTSFDYSPQELYGAYAYKRKSPSINLGDNTGIHDSQGVVIPEYGLIALGDNDGDGVIDGTGLVTANTDSCVYQIDNQWVGPYGRHHEKVSSHAVAVLSDFQGSNWQFIGGQLKGTNSIEGVSENTYDDGSGTGQYTYPNESKFKMYQSQLNATINKALMICSDIHFGDRMASKTLSSTSTITASNGETWVRGTADIKYWSPGEIVGRALCTKINATTAEIGASTYSSTYDALGNYLPYQNGYSKTETDDSGSTTTYYSNGTKRNISSQLKITDISPNGYGNNNKRNYHRWYTFPNRKKNDGTRSTNTITSELSIPKVLTLGMNQIRHRNSVLNYRAGYMLRPIVEGFEHLNINQKTVISMPSAPDAIFHKDNPGFATLAYSTEVQSATHNSFTLTIDDNAGSPAAPYADTAATEAVFLNEMVYKSDGSEFGICTSVTNNTTLVFAAGIKNAMANDDRLYVGYKNYTTNTLTNINSAVNNKVFLSSTFEPELDLPAESRLYIADTHVLAPSETSDRYIHIDTQGLSDNSSSYYTPNVTSTMLSSPYITTASSTTTLHRSADSYPLIKLDGTQSTIFGTDSGWMNTASNSGSFPSAGKWGRSDNGLAGMIISVITSDGFVETRQIIASKAVGGNSSDAVYAAVHFPFGRAPQAGDSFMIWGNASACLAPLRLYKTKDESYGSLNLFTKDPFTNVTPFQIASDEVQVATQSYKGTINSGLISVTDTAGVARPHNLSIGDIIEFYDSTIVSNGAATVSETPSLFTFKVTGISSGSGETVYYKDNINENNTVWPQASNPANGIFAMPTFKTTFGGLDLRQLQYGVVTEIADSDASAKLAITSTGNKLAVGDKISLDHGITADADQQGSYEVTDAGNTFKVINSDTGASTATGISFLRNLYELFYLDASGESKIAEIRASLGSWDKGVSQGNLLRRDNATASNSDRYVLFGESSVEITSNAVGDEDGDYFQPGEEYKYKISFTYDGFQEGVLSSSSWTAQNMIDSSATMKYLNIYILMSSWSNRITSVNLYRKDGSNSFYRLVKQINTDSGWTAKENSFFINFRDEGEVGPAYEARTGMSEVLINPYLKYGLATEIDNMLFVGNCKHENIGNAENQIFKSKPGKYSIFDWSSDTCVLKSKPTAMTNFAGKLFVFDENHTYRINPHSFVIEDEYEGIGCLSQESLVTTENAMYFANKNGAYKHNGQMPIKISSMIESGGDEDTFTSSDGVVVTENIKDLDWYSLVRNNSEDVPKVIYDSKNNCVLFFISKNIMVNNSLVKHDYIWCFNIIRVRWDLWQYSKESIVGNPFTGKNGNIYIPINQGIYEFKAGGKHRDFTWVSKKLAMGQDSINKVYTKIKINGSKEHLALTESGNYSSEKLIIKTNNGLLSNYTYKKIGTEDSEYKLSGSNRKGRWVQIKLEDIENSIDSIGFVYRRKTVK